MRSRRRQRRLEWVPAYLETLRRCGVYELAAAAAEVDPRAVRRHRHRDAVFAAREQDALDEWQTAERQRRLQNVRLYAKR